MVSGYTDYGDIVAGTQWEAELNSLAFLIFGVDPVAMPDMPTAEWKQQGLSPAECIPEMYITLTEDYGFGDIVPEPPEEYMNLYRG